MSWARSILDFFSNVFGFVTEYFKKKNEKDIKERKMKATDNEFKDVAKKAIANKDIKKIRDLLSE
jgi:hypothetical protein